MSESSTKPIAYWPDGFWTSSISDAETIDLFKSFGDMKHSSLEVPKGSTVEEITALVGQAIENSESIENVDNLEAREEA